MNNTDIYELVSTSLVNCMAGKDHCIYAIMNAPACLGGFQISDNIKNIMESKHLFEIKINVNNFDNSISGNVTLFTDGHRLPQYEFVYDSMGILNSDKLQIDFMTYMTNVIQIALDAISKGYSQFVTQEYSMLLGDKKEEPLPINDLIDIKIDGSVLSQGDGCTVVQPTSYEQYSYRKITFDSNKKISAIKNVDTDSKSSTPEKIDEIKNKLCHILCRDNNDESKVEIIYTTTTANGDKFSATNEFETQYIFGNKCICLRAEYGDTTINEIVPPEVIDYIDIKEVKKSVIYTVFSTLELLHKITSSTVDVYIYHHTVVNDGVIV